MSDKNNNSSDIKNIMRVRLSHTGVTGFTSFVESRTRIVISDEDIYVAELRGDDFPPVSKVKSADVKGLDPWLCKGDYVLNLGDSYFTVEISSGKKTKSKRDGSGKLPVRLLLRIGSNLPEGFFIMSGVSPVEFGSMLTSFILSEEFSPFMDKIAKSISMKVNNAVPLAVRRTKAINSFFTTNSNYRMVYKQTRLPGLEITNNSEIKYTGSTKSPLCFDIDAMYNLYEVPSEDSVLRLGVGGSITFVVTPYMQDNARMLNETEIASHINNSIVVQKMASAV